MTTELQTTQEIDPEIQRKFDEQEATFRKSEASRDTLRRFFNTHRDAISPFHWRAYGWTDAEIVFISYLNEGRSKDIAKAFGKEGWTRHTSHRACGSIDWKKTVDGCLLIIECAEHITPKLIEEVKL